MGVGGAPVRGMGAGPPWGRTAFTSRGTLRPFIPRLLTLNSASDWNCSPVVLSREGCGLEGVGRAASGREYHDRCGRDCGLRCGRASR